MFGITCDSINTYVAAAAAQADKPATITGLVGGL